MDDLIDVAPLPASPSSPRVLSFRNRRVRELAARNRRKIRIYKLKKGCQFCGYDRCAAALELHHIDPATKSFEISNLLDKSSSRRLWAEVEKCAVLCANCHRELHDREGAAE